MTVPVFTGPVPSRLSSPETFSADTDSYHAELAGVIAGMNETAIAMNLNSTTDISGTSLAISLGSKSLTVSASKSFQAGMYLILADSAAPSTNSMVVQVTSYNAGTGAMVAECVQAKGSGTKTSWVISQSAAPSSDISATMLPVTSAATLGAAREALGLKQQQSIDYTLSGNALTLKLNPTNLDFRSGTYTSGTPVSVANAAQITTTISSGSTGGTVSGVQSEILILAINNAGTMELAWTNASGGLILNEAGVINTVAEGGAGGADSNNVIYSTTARTGVAYRVVGVFRSTQTTAGTWAQAPTLVQGYGGGTPSPVAAENAMGVTRSLTTSGYRKTGDGLIEQWGTTVATTNAGSAIPVTFPIAFPTAAYTVVAVNGDGGATLGAVLISTWTTTTFTAVFVIGGSGIGAGLGVRVNWYAKGI